MKNIKHQDCVEYTSTEFVSYLRETLIPDLVESGNVATAVDFETACKFICGDSTVWVPCGDEAGRKFLSKVQ